MVTRSDMACKCGCGFDTFDYELRDVIHGAEVHFGLPVTVISGCRCPKHNAEVNNSSPRSQHINGRAADMCMAGISAQQLGQYFLDKYPDKFGIHAYENSVHVDTKSGKARRW
jgi:uncharacterized protein YcbK (DUF882 family)